MRPRERLLRKDIPKEAIRKELEHWSDRLTGWDQFFTAIVVGGLAIEYLPDAASFLAILSHTVFLVLRADSDPLHEFGGLIVIAGIIGEFCVASRERKVESDLRDESNSEVGTLRERAAQAEERTARLQIEVGRARERQADAEERIDKLRRAQAPRASIFSVREFTEFLGPLARGNVEIFFLLEDSEAFQFASVLRHALTLAEWDVKEPMAVTASPIGIPALLGLGANAQGVTVLSRSEPTSLGSPYKILCDAFTYIEFPISGRIDSRAPHDALWLVVGPKP